MTWERATCTLCGKEHKTGGGWNEKRRGCADVAACTGRTLKGMVARPFVGDFDPAAAYKSAPKIGDAA